MTDKIAYFKDRFTISNDLFRCFRDVISATTCSSFRMYTNVNVLPGQDHSFCGVYQGIMFFIPETKCRYVCEIKYSSSFSFTSRSHWMRTGRSLWTRTGRSPWERRTFCINYTFNNDCRIFIFIHFFDLLRTGNNTK